MAMVRTGDRRDEELGAAAGPPDETVAVRGPPLGHAGAPPGQHFRESDPPSNSFDSEDFLFHLYRGSELLADSCVAEAKHELEQALRMQPRDAEGQGLLGIVYFRLGMYPQAISIYEELMRAFPAEVTPRINAALCFLKTGQHQRARELLEEVLQIVPDHARAWGYLGLVFERLGDYAKAGASFERAGQPQMVQRMDRRLAATSSYPPEPEPPTGERAELREAAAEAVRELEMAPSPFTGAAATPAVRHFPSDRWRAVELGRHPEPRRSQPPASRVNPEPAGSSVRPPPTQAEAAPLPALTPQEFAQINALPMPAADLSVLGEHAAVVRVDGVLAVRLRALRALLPGDRPFRSSLLSRRSLGRTLDEPLGGIDAQLGSLEGRGHVALAAHPGASLVLLRLAEELLYVCESRLVAFDDSIRYESGKLARGAAVNIPMVQLSGRGNVLLERRGPVRAIRVDAERLITVEAERVLGWTGRLLPRPSMPEEVPTGSTSYVAFGGDGSLFLELPE